ncbi:MAG: photosynthesis system II assembly factor Ycf48 [Xenococcaceae cyanobacterium]
MNLFVKTLKQILILLTISLLCISCSTMPSTSYNPWKTLTLPTEASLAGVAFTDDLKHGWVVGTQASLFETTDGGDNWQQRVLELGDEKISFTGVSFNGEEGWIIGEPSILLHTNDAGKSWSRIPLSSRLPGSPYGIFALGQSSAEMVTNLGAIYKTTDGGRNWKALVEGAVGVARNINRSADGKYVAVSARGNFYSTWEPGQSEWTPHNRTSSRRLQNMGFTNDDRLWLIARGGQIQFSKPDALEEWEDVKYPEAATSWGFLDVAFRTPEEIWVAGGSGNLLCSFDGGQTWEKDRALEEVPSNFYKVVFTSPNSGFVMGQRGILLKYEPSDRSASAA